MNVKYKLKMFYIETDISEFKPQPNDKPIDLNSLIEKALKI